MLGKTAGGLFWMFRHLERSENTSRLLDAGFRMALTRSQSAEGEWKSVVTTAGMLATFEDKHEQYDAPTVIDFLLRDKHNPSSVINVIEGARNNARMVRTALTREVWEATNECWINLAELLSKPIPERELPNILATVRQQSALVRGAMQGTMVRNEIYDFARIGSLLERADNTARILNVKYYVLLPSISHVGSSLDNVQWETILRSVSAQRAYRWLHGGKVNPKTIADILILDQRLPRSLAFCHSRICDTLTSLEKSHGHSRESKSLSQNILNELEGRTIEQIFESGLHEFIENFLGNNHRLGVQIEQDYRFYG